MQVTTIGLDIAKNVFQVHGTAIAVLAIPWMLPRQKGSQIFPDFFEGATTTVA